MVQLRLNRLDQTMAKPKTGELRILKGGNVFGPMLREDLERLLAAGRIEPADQVSVLGAPWITVEEYLTPLPPDQEPIPERCLQVLKGRRVFPPMTRQEVIDLAAAGRVGDEDLISALGGPWMRLAEFFAAPVRPQELEEHDSDSFEVMPQHALELGRFRIQDLLEENREFPDVWYLRVRGIHTSPLQKWHIRQLYESREITLDCPIRNATWRSDDWRRIREVAEVTAELLRS
jgi:hypothetical protein